MRLLLKFLLLFSSLFLTGFSKSNIDMVDIDYVSIANKITIETAKQIEREKPLFIIGLGGNMMNTIKEMSLSLTTKNSSDLNNARALLIYCSNRYLQNINSNKEIRPFLHNFPFLPKNVDIEILFNFHSNSTNQLNQLAFVHCKKGRIYYYKDGTDGAIYEETFEDALKIVQESNL